MFTVFENPLNVLQLSSKVLVAGLVMLLAGIYGAYLYQGHMPIALLVAMHAMTIVGPTLIKIGYVMRLLSQYRLGRSPALAVA
ncbi:transmembrane sensor/regulator PpyR [Pseudomonas sp. FW215-R2]|uniref:transmembrane sensor/regulator PpyR n=1 Tax=unclassified Pseudomonas TaxID=196821 RepID=UPI000C880CE6|nr:MULTISPECIES: transmembrane sensor/regulator PpyR [unclassified Pseudomonas]PMW98881.1 transmembrane sensor/regulator PpyR [Pseudomonas sp. FW215-R2]PMX06954.1 transmembrane sensor/regulator PpyR [Pseudomonas sp. FW215-L1]PMX24406.1 transmembrane sensor/regulator PpyR [Pseudomonas sp. FW215-E1]PNA26376.1 transmembrane sensor/regulator PpyR [Pseudomonas sp. FW215-R4]